MKIPNKTLKNGFAMPVIGKGTWMTNIGSKARASLKDEGRIEEITRAITNEITYIDTAERYANGYGETLIGKAIKGHHREQLFLVSKVSSDHLKYDNVIAAAKSSIKRLQASYLDLYLIHQFNPDISLEETMRAMDYLIEKKLIKHIGVCNFTVEQIEKAQSYTKNKIVANQSHYNVMFREPEESGIIEYCQKQDIMIIAWRPFEENLLTEKTKAVLDELAKKYKITPSQVAFLWLIAQANTVALAKLSTDTRIKQTLDSLEIKISPEDMNKLTEKGGAKHDK
jgi:diketogulonate reductase-like aldo/keto reductase